MFSADDIAWKPPTDLWVFATMPYKIFLNHLIIICHLHMIDGMLYSRFNNLQAHTQDDRVNILYIPVLSDKIHSKQPKGSYVHKYIIINRPDYHT